MEAVFFRVETPHIHTIAIHGGVGKLSLLVIKEEMDTN